MCMSVCMSVYVYECVCVCVMCVSVLELSELYRGGTVFLPFVGPPLLHSLCFLLGRALEKRKKKDGSVCVCVCVCVYVWRQCGCVSTNY